MVAAGPLRLWQSAYLGWLLAWILLLGRWAASAPASRLPTAIDAATVATGSSAGDRVTQPRYDLPSRANASSQGFELRGLVDSDLDGGQLDGGGTAGPPTSSTSSSLPVSGEDEDEDKESVVSLVPLFILLASFLLIIVSCVVVCQRIRNSHKNRYHLEEQNYRIQAAAYQLVVASDANRSVRRSSSSHNGKPALDSNGNVRSSLVKFADDTGLTASVVTCVQPTVTSSCGGEKPRSILIDRDSLLPHLTASGAKDHAPSKSTGAAAGAATAAATVATAAAADTVPQAVGADRDGKVVQTNQLVQPASSGSGNHHHVVTFADTAAGVRKTSSLKCIKSPRPPSPGPRSPGARVGQNDAFHAADGKPLRVAFFDESVAVHGPNGRNVKIARMHSLDHSLSSRSATALSSMTSAAASPYEDVSLDATAAAEQHLLSHGVPPAQSNGRRRKKQSRSSSSPSNSSGHSSPREPSLTAFGVAKSHPAERKPANRASLSSTMATAAVKRRHHSEGRPAARRRPLSAAPRLVGIGVRLHWRQHDSPFGDPSYDPDDGEDLDESETDFARCRRPGKQLLPASVVHRSAIVGSSGDS